VKKSSLSKEKVALIAVPALGLILGLLGYLVLVSPQKSKAAHLATQLDAARTQVVTAKARPKPVVPSAHAADIFRLTKAMPDSSDFSGVLLELARVARESSVSLQSVKPSPAVPMTQGYGALPLDVTVDGTFGHVSGFLQRLRQAVSIDRRGRLHVTGRLIVADQVGLTSSDGRTVQATLSMNAFVYGLTPPPAPTTTDATDTTQTTTTTPSGSSG
jgi:hypothetical protein